jgi:hypothetical protein
MSGVVLLMPQDMAAILALLEDFKITKPTLIPSKYAEGTDALQRALAAERKKAGLG